MKKNYLFLAAAATMFTACVQNDLVSEIPQETPQAIGFETFANKQTRAITGTNATKLEKFHDNFGVWAYKTPTGSTESTVMDNFKVTYDDATVTDWKYAGVNGQQLKYWDKTATYEFFAYAPYHASNVSIDSDDIQIKEGTYAANENLQTVLSQTQNENTFTGEGESATKSTDWMVAAKITKDGSNKTTVEEVFSHTMSKLTVILKSTVANTKINSVSVNNVYGKGSYENKQWIASGVTTSITGATGNMENDNKGYYTMEYLLIPSTKAPTFSINYTVNGDTYEQKNVYIYGIDKFAANTSYTLTVTIDLAAIQFSAENNDWTPDDNGNTTID